ncbi:MAG: HK97 family phage prohead protease [Alphaproteobacteria bacterium]|nr:HK97 family phage prohead protease [Alphaproteobacteria bacterium]
MDIKHMTRTLAIKTLAADGTFAGYASVFGTLDHHNEVVDLGAFKRTLGRWREKGSAPAMLWMHDPTQPIGVWMTLDEDKNGLAVQGRLALRTQKGMEAYELLKLGALTGLSIGYRVVTSRIDSKRKARVLTELDLFEISLVTFPANEEARVRDVKSPNAQGAPRQRAKTDVAATETAVARLQRAARALQKRG